MPGIFPFNGWRYNVDKVPDPAQVIAPPYDVIDSTEQQQLYDASPYNFVRLILNKAEGEERYREASRILKEWTREGIIHRDQHPGFYLVDQTFDLKGETVTRTGLVGALDLEELGDDILPHEQTIDKYITDRYRLMEETSANLGQIFLSFRDKSLTVESVGEPVRTEEPLLDVDIPGHTRYRLWAITNQKDISRINETLAESSAIIADGHHRYKTALQFARDHQEVPGSNRVMATLVNAYNPGMSILPTHRLVKGVQTGIDELRKELQQFFHVEEFPAPETMLRQLRDTPSGDKTRLGFYHKQSGSAFLLGFHGENLLETVFPDAPDAYKRLDVNILHHFVLKEILDLDTENQEDLERIEYIRGNAPVMEMLRQHQDYDVACFVNPPDVDTIFRIAESGRTLPQKTTYFFPKIYSGLIFRRLE